MRRTLILAAVAAVALLGTSCKPSATDIYPMSVGSVWNMEMYGLSGTTTASLDTFLTGTGTNTAVEKTTLTGGQEVVKFKNETSFNFSASDSTFDTTVYSYVREDGNAILSYSALDDTTGDTVLMTNLSVGQKWNQGSSGTAEVIGQENVTVKAGTYKNAWKVKLTTAMGGTSDNMYYWYAKGIGLVKMHYEFTAGGYTQKYNQELTSATIK